jgi:uncharacterized protein
MSRESALYAFHSVKIKFGETIASDYFEIKGYSPTSVLPKGARVVSADRFQGQEAPVVVVSLCSSAEEFGSRGMSFILDRKRIKVALSRNHARAIVVGDQNIAATTANSVNELWLLNVCCGFHRMQVN